MSVLSNKPRLQDMIDTTRGPIKCRIPQRLPPGRARPPTTSNSSPRSRPSNNPVSLKQKYEVTSSLNTRFGAKTTTSRPRSDETRPKSASRLKEELFPNNRQAHNILRSTRPNERMPTAPKRPAAMPKKPSFVNHVGPNKSGRSFIMVPMSQRSSTKCHHKNASFLPDQDTITKHEDMELQLSEISDNTSVVNDRFEKESITSRSDMVMQLKISWQEKMVHFEQMKIDLKDRQNALLELYAAMRDTHQKMTSLGEQASLPAAEDLRIMNVSKMSPEQLLQLCAGDDSNVTRDKQFGVKASVAIDINKLYAMPSKLVDTCEQTLKKRKEIIDWFESLKSQEKGISVHKLSKKINEFNAENDMMKCSLDQVKTEFLVDLEEIVNLMRKGINETIALQLRTEEMTYELSELNSQNTDLRKQIQNADHLRSQSNKNRIEELEKELKEEKCKRVFMRDRLNRAEGQVKINIERVSHLEAALEQARSQTWSLERTVQQLHEQNEKLQSDFDKELNKLTESIKENTVHLEEIAEAREKLQTEKEDLEKRLTEISLYYNEAHNNIKQENNINIAKLVETEKKCKHEASEKKRLEEKLESLCTQLVESELRHKDTLKQLHEKETLQEKIIEDLKILDATKRELEKANLEIDNNNNLIIKQGEAIKDFEMRLREAVKLEQTLKSDLTIKEDYIKELEKKQILLEKQLQENENKMESYVDQLSSLKTHINQLQDDFGEFENLNELYEMINQQRAKLLEATHQNGELAEALQKKNEELERYNASLSEHEQLLLEREGVIKMLSEKDEEQSNIIKIMRNNLELRSQADNDLSQQLVEKNAEIDSLIVNIETRKQQISNMEKIILTLEDQTRKASVQRNKDKEHFMLLQKKVAEYETLHMEATRNMDTPTENLDSLIKILEDELGTSMEPDLGSKVDNCKKKGDRKRDKLERHEDNNSSRRYQCEPDVFPTKIVMGNFVKKTYIPSTEEHYMGDNLDRKKAITNIETQKWVSVPEAGLNVYAPKPSTKDNNMSNLRRLVLPGQQKPALFTRNLQYLNPDQIRDDKKYKMFKLTSHRL